jgi:hypothetical protein
MWRLEWLGAIPGACQPVVTGCCCYGLSIMLFNWLVFDRTEQGRLSGGGQAVQQHSNVDAGITQ